MVVFQCCSTLKLRKNFGYIEYNKPLIFYFYTNKIIERNELSLEVLVGGNFVTVGKLDGQASCFPLLPAFMLS